ncbi:tetraspanin-33-like [Kryptolebias marmoratus]|uniref:tetraspanin-33-like n=1 Tax=Kryptolebias marmoratus TaxID=37003 RepID=UPI0018ACF161|nr:tetraspanin-33-like [Kryptolebias marmoratus]
MGKVNICLKRTYISVISLIGTILILLLRLTIFAHSYFLDSEEVEVNPTLDFNYVFCTINLIIVIIGGYGVLKEIKWALIAFAVGATLIFLFLLGREIDNQLLNQKIRNTRKRLNITILPLANATERELTFLSRTQTEFQCCGVESYRDWENNIPESCVCDDESTNPCMAAPRDINVLMRGQNIRIYSKRGKVIHTERISLPEGKIADIEDSYKYLGIPQANGNLDEEGQGKEPQPNTSNE